MRLQIICPPFYWIYRLSSLSDGEVNRVTAWNGNGKSQLLWHLQRKGVNRLVVFYVFREGKSISTRSACNVLITLLTKYPGHSGLISQVFRTPCKNDSSLYASLYVSLYANYMYNRKRSFTESSDPTQHHSYRHSFVVTFSTIPSLVSGERFLHCINLRVTVSTQRWPTWINHRPISQSWWLSQNS